MEMFSFPFCAFNLVQFTRCEKRKGTEVRVRTLGMGLMRNRKESLTGVSRRSQRANTIAEPSRRVGPRYWGAHDSGH